LKKWKAYQFEKNIAFTEDDAFVFSSRNGEMRTYDGFKGNYKRFLIRHNLSKYNLHLHRYRHTFATMLLEEGVNPKVVQKLLGHKDVQTTLGIYSHVLAEVYESTANKVTHII